MKIVFKKIILEFIFNSGLFFILKIGIQNSTNKGKLNFYINETISLPISFIIGTSFISGSVTGSLISLIWGKKIKEKRLYIYNNTRAIARWTFNC